MSTLTEKYTLEEYAEFCKQTRDSIDVQTEDDMEEYTFRDVRYLKLLEAIEKRDSSM